jgi:hypothetical protein
MAATRCTDSEREAVRADFLYAALGFLHTWRYEGIELCDIFIHAEALEAARLSE